MVFLAFYVNTCEGSGDLCRSLSGTDYLFGDAVCRTSFPLRLHYAASS